MNKRRISRKYLNDEFASLILNLAYRSLEREYMAIRGGGSLEEWAYYFGLEELREITLESLLRFLKNRGCIEVERKENRIRLKEDLFSLLGELEAKLKSKK